LGDFPHIIIDLLWAEIDEKLDKIVLYWFSTGYHAKWTAQHILLKGTSIWRLVFRIFSQQ